jgi:hypothetical protein
MENAVFWDVTLCSSCQNKRFRGRQSFHHQSDKNRWVRNVNSKQQPTRVGKKYYFLHEPHDVTSQKTAFFIVITVQTSNLAQNYSLGLCSGEVICLLWGTKKVLISHKTAFFIVTAVKPQILLLPELLQLRRGEPILRIHNTLNG